MQDVNVRGRLWETRRGQEAPIEVKWEKMKGVHRKVGAEIVLHGEVPPASSSPPLAGSTSGSDSVSVGTSPSSSPTCPSSSPPSAAQSAVASSSSSPTSGGLSSSQTPTGRGAEARSEAGSGARHGSYRRFEGYGVLKVDKREDLTMLVEEFTAPALATALRDRETTLHNCAHLLGKDDLAGLKQLLRPFEHANVTKSRKVENLMDLTQGFKGPHMDTLKKKLQRMPRHIARNTEHRASVMVPLCNVDGVASILFTLRSDDLRAHRNEVCFPGGKVDFGIDRHIVNTAMRELTEEVGLQTKVDVLGVLRCDWSEVASIVGVAVTPVVGFIGQLSGVELRPNPDEVSHCFSVPIKALLDSQYWVLEPNKAPAFTGGPYIIWGLTGYILHRFVSGVLKEHPLRV